MPKRTPEHNAKIAAALRARGVAASPTKRCPRCGEDKPRGEFPVRANGQSESWCRPCRRLAGAERQRKRWADATPEQRQLWRDANRATQYRRKYGITVAERDALYAAQDGRCAICRRPEGEVLQAGSPGGRPRVDGKPPADRGLVVDHCHDGGRVRALLCQGCNVGLGAFGDDPDRLEAAARWLRAQ